MNLCQKISYYILLGMSKAIGRLPYRVLYFWVVDFIYFVLYKIIHYRLSVVRTNLRNSFPEKSKEELLLIERSFYKNLSEIFVDILVISSLPLEQLKKRFYVENADQIKIETQGKSWICAMAHYGEWEYASFFTYQTDHDLIGVYRPLHNKVVDQFYLHCRARNGAIPTPMNAVAKTILKSDKPIVVAMIADQTPPYHEIHHWFDFLSQPTPFFMGNEKLALKFKMPIYFLTFRKIARGVYRGHFDMIYDGQEIVEPYEITTRYAAKLEEVIRQTPELWLWSHRRWKHKPPTQ